MAFPEGILCLLLAAIASATTNTPPACQLVSSRNRGFLAHINNCERIQTLEIYDLTDLVASLRPSQLREVNVLQVHNPGVIVCQHDTISYHY